MPEVRQEAKARAESISRRFYGHTRHVVSETYLIDSTVVRSNECFGMPFLTVHMPRRESAGLSQPAASARNGRSAFTSDPGERLNAA